MPSKLVNHILWWSGPKWLISQSSCLLTQDSKRAPSAYEIEEEEVEIASYVTVLPTPEILTRYSSYSRLLRITAWCLRFIKNCRSTDSRKDKHHLQGVELDSALMCIVKVVQYAHFQSEIHDMKMKGHLHRTSPFLPLNVFLDKHQVLRVGGRLRLAEISEQQKYPILLPRNHHFTDLVIDYYHKRSLHGGIQVVLSLIRQRFWFTSARNKVRANLSRCVVCFRLKVHRSTQLMGDLPKARVIPSKPFQRVGIDFTGPIVTKPNLQRSRVTLKSYIALFICFSTKAVHLELVSDLTTDAFLAALRRFTARRGVPSDIYTDNATNFQGTKNYLKAHHQILQNEAVQSFATEQQITWHFIPPLSPNFGGLWEANIKVMKHHLLKTCKSAILNFEELTTLLTQIEACLNSRPLTYLSTDPEDLQPLTPGHFLIGSAPLAFPETAEKDIVSLRARWKLIQHLRAEFWNRWSKEYLTQLNMRAKWQTPKPNVQQNQLVLLKDDKTNPMQWSLGRIVALHPGSDNYTRIVDVYTSSGVFRRPISKVCPLPLQD